MNCSLGPRKYTAIKDDTTFPCQIKRGKLNENALGPLTPCSNSNCEPALLQSLKLTKLTRWLEPTVGYRWSAIQLLFSLPVPSYDNGYGAGAIEITFSSGNKTKYDDFEFGQIYRVFDFNSYSYTSPDQDRSNPNNTRILRFPCFMGFFFERCPSDNYKVYSLRLKTFSKWQTKSKRTPFTEITYNITVYGYYVYHRSLWKSTIALTLFPGNRDVTVVFDPAPDSIKVSMYNVSLVKNESNETYRYKLVIGKQEGNRPLCFENTPDGLYYVSIDTIRESNDQEKNIYTESHTIMVGSPKPNHDSVSSPDEGKSFNPIFMSVGGGVFLAITLLAVLCYHHRWKTSTRLSKEMELSSFTRVLLIYSNNNQMNSDLANELAAFCKRNMQLKVIYDQLDDERYSINEKSYSHWYREKLEDSSAAIILWTPGSDVDNQEGERSSNEFNTGVTMALNSKIQDHKKIVCVYLVKSHKLTVPPDIQKEARVYYFPEKLSSIFYYLHGRMFSRPKCIDNNSRFKQLVSQLEDSDLNNGNVDKTISDETPELKETHKTTPLKNIDDEILELKRQFFSPNLSSSSNSSKSNTESVAYNPDCPIHGEVLNKKHRPHPKHERHYLRDNRRALRGFDPGEIEPLQSCHRPGEYDNVVYLPGAEFFAENRTGCHEEHTPHHVRDRVFRDDFDCIHQETSVQYGRDLDYPCHVGNRNVHHHTGFQPNLDWNGPPCRSNHYRTYGGNTRDDESSFLNKNSDLFIQRDISFDEDSEEMSLTNKNPKFYLEEEEANEPSIGIRRLNSLDSLTSNSSNNSKYSKRSESIDSFELKQSLQKFI